MSKFLKNGNRDSDSDSDPESDNDDEEEYEPKPKIKIHADDADLDADLDVDKDSDNGDVNDDDDEDNDNEDDDDDNDNDDSVGMENNKWNEKEKERENEEELKRQFHLNDEDLSESDDDDDDDDNYLQKFDESIQRDIIQEHHPEMIMHNYQEVEAMLNTTRDENGIIIDPLHRTNPFITRYEYARVLGERAKQINSGAKPFIKTDENLIDGYLIALEEYRQKKIPFIIKRPLPNGGCEYWSLNDLENIM